MWMMWLAVAMAGEGEPAGFDHSYAEFDRFLEGAVTDDGVDYELLRGRSEALAAHLKEVATADVASFTHAEKLAFYVNAYNGYTLHTILEEWPVASIRDLDGGQVWKRRRFMVGTASLTLDDMEHQQARKLGDGRIHAVVNCASKGCPPLPPDPLRATGIDAQLDRAAARWVRVNGLVVLDETEVQVSKIFEWYSEDFAGFSEGDIAGVQGTKEAALWFCARYAPEPLAQRLTSGELQVSFHAYDWSLNAR